MGRGLKNRSAVILACRLVSVASGEYVAPYAGAWIEIAYKKCGLFPLEQYRIFAIKIASLFLPVLVVVSEESYNKFHPFQKTLRSV